MKITAWYPGNVKPVRNGWYHVMLLTNWTCGYWNGKSWTWGPGCTKFKNQYREWRGLAEEPK